LSDTVQHNTSQVGYGMAELGVSAIESFLRLYLLLFLTTKVGLSPTAAGYAVSIGILWDAFADPIMGRISDKTRSRWGPRLPWIAAGAPLLGLAFVLLFRVGHIDEFFSPTHAFLYVTFLNILLNTAMSIVSVPHLALGGELAPDNAERRTSIYAWRSAMTLLGFLVGILIPASVNALGYALVNADFIFAVVIALIMLLAVAITIISCRKNTSSAIEETSSPGPVLGSILRGKVAVVMGAFFVATLAQGLNSALAMYYYLITLKLNEQDIGRILIVFIVSLCLTLPLWVKWSARYSKPRLVAVGTIGLGVLSCVFYPIFYPGDLLGPYFMAIAGGALLGSSGLLESMLVDTAESQQISSASMGAVFGLWKFVAKAARAVAIAGAGNLLAAVGYTANGPTDPSVASNIGWLFGPAVGILFIMSGLILIWRPSFHRNMMG
jgi:Na+/melibiose symporter-like transporter